METNQTKGHTMFTIELQLPGGRTATKQIESERDARAEVERVRKDIFIAGIKLIAPDGTLLGLYGTAV